MNILCRYMVVAFFVSVFDLRADLNQINKDLDFVRSETQKSVLSLINGENGLGPDALSSRLNQIKTSYESAKTPNNDIDNRIKQVAQDIMLRQQLDQTLSSHALSLADRKKVGTADLESALKAGALNLDTFISLVLARINLELWATSCNVTKDAFDAAQLVLNMNSTYKSSKDTQNIDKIKSSCGLK